ncbi:hypothetical protein BaRGS_00009645, partial [Batillaria attramentaria]
STKLDWEPGWSNRISLHGAPEMPPSWLMHDMSLHEMVITVDATVDIQWNLNGPEADLGNISISDDDSLPDVIAVSENTGPDERLETVIEKWQSTTKITVTQEIKVSLDPPGELLRQALQIYIEPADAAILAGDEAVQDMLSDCKVRVAIGERNRASVVTAVLASQSRLKTKHAMLQAFWTGAEVVGLWTLIREHGGKEACTMWVWDGSQVVNVYTFSLLKPACAQVNLGRRMLDINLYVLLGLKN